MVLSLQKWYNSTLKETDVNVNKEIVCEHGYLKPVENKVKITEMLWQYLLTQFPASTPFSISEYNCSICTKAMNDTLKDDEEKKSNKIEEKNLLNDVYKKQYLFTNCLKPDKVYYMLSRQWVTDWKKFINTNNAPFPRTIDNQAFVTCQDLSGLDDQSQNSTKVGNNNKIENTNLYLAFDPVEDQQLFYIVEERDWMNLVNIYNGGPPITIMKTGQTFVTDPPTNSDLIAKRKIDDSISETDFKMGTVTVTYKARGKKGALVNKNLKVKTNADTQVDKFKLQIFEVSDFIPIQQTLYFNKIKLENHKTLFSYGIKENSVVELEISEGDANDDMSWTDVFNVHENAIEEGFKGSVLHDSGSLSSSSSAIKSNNNKTNNNSPQPSSPSPINNNNNNKNNNNSPQLSSSMPMKLEPAYWACSLCTVHNFDMKADTCDTCGTQKVVKTNNKKQDIWKCKHCTLDNNVSETKCGACDEPRK